VLQFKKKKKPKRLVQFVFIKDILNTSEFLMQTVNESKRYVLKMKSY